MGNLKITMLEYYRFIFLYIFLFIWTFRKYKLFNIVENQNLWLSKEGRGNQAGSRERGNSGGCSYIHLLDHNDDFTCAKAYQII